MKTRLTVLARLIRSSVATATAFLALGINIAAQQGQVSQYDRGTPPQHAAGVSAIGSYISADLGAINLSNGTLSFRLPLGNVGGRGFWLPLTLNYSSKVWSGSRGLKFNPEPPPGHSDPVVWGQYTDAGFEFEDIFNKVAPGWTIGAAPYLRARGVGIGPHHNPGNGCDEFDWVVVKLTVVLPDKGEIELRDEMTNGAPRPAGLAANGCRTQDGQRGKRWYATDGSGTLFINTNNNGVVNGDLSGVLIMPDGTRYHFVNASGPPANGSAHLKNLGRCDWIEDRNGNRVAIAYPNGFEVRYTDQLGRVTKVQWNNPAGGGLPDPENPGVQLAMLVTLPGAGASGTVHYFKAKTGLMNACYREDIDQALPVFNGTSETAFVGTALFNGAMDAGLAQIDDVPVLSQFILPDARALTFRYNEYGEVAEVQLPAGGKVQYDYVSVPVNAGTGAGLPAGNTVGAEAVAPGGGNVLAVDRAVVARRTYPDGVTLEGSWTYTYKAQVTGGVATGDTRVKCFSGSTVVLDEVHFFRPAQRFILGPAGGVDNTGYSLWSTGLERRVEQRASNGTTVLAASEQDWAQRVPVSWTTGFTTQQIANDNRVIEQRKILDDGSSAKMVTTYEDLVLGPNHVNAPFQVDEYDFGGTRKRYTTTSYLMTAPYMSATDTTRNLVGLPLQQTVFDNAGVEYAKTDYEYDNYSSDDNEPLTMYFDFTSITGHSTSYDTAFTPRGNITKVTRKVDASTSISTYTRYDVLGNVVSIKDPKEAVSSIGYVDDFGTGANPGFGSTGSFGPTYSLPTLFTSPPPNAGEPAHEAHAQYDFNTGLLTGFKDRNNVIGRTIYNDPFDRPTQIVVADNVPALRQHTQMYYAGATPVTVFGVTLTANDMLTATDQTTLDDGNLRSWVRTDGFGRTVDQFTRDPQGDVRATTSYDGLGRVRRVTNPYRTTADPTYGYADTSYDMLGRVTRVETFDGGSVSSGAVVTSYAGPRVLVTDQAGKQRISKTNALGHLTEVWEITAADSATEPVTFPSVPGVTDGYVTRYTYDVLDNLTTVTQRIGSGGTLQTRTFEYDSLKRLTQASNPESGTILCTYDANSNLETREDAREIRTEYEYDALNRVISRKYFDDPENTPPVFYRYDNQGLPANAPPGFLRGFAKGRLVAVTYGDEFASSGTYTGYDQLGQVNTSVQQTDGVNYGFSYGYNLAGAMTTETYPTGRTVTHSYDDAGRLDGITGQKSGEPNKTYASTFSYASHGAVGSMKLGNLKWEHTIFNTRLQPTEIGLGSNPTDSALLKLVYEYGTTSNNGNVLSQQIVVSGSMDVKQIYTYDDVNRLLTAKEINTQVPSQEYWRQTYDMDRFGNRAVRNTSFMPNSAQTPQSTSATDFSAFNQAANRLSQTKYPSLLYDDAGNLTRDIVNRTFAFDAENRQVKFNTNAGRYFYAGDGHRVKKVEVGETTITTVFVYNALSQLIAEYRSDGPQAGGTSYLTTDHLGSTRVVTGALAGGVVAVRARYDYLPYGEELMTNPRTSGLGYSSADSTRQKFTQKERDSESGLDYFLARYYSSAQGRFLSVDPGNAGGNVRDPQSWNGYAYGRDNPLRYVDPDGRKVRVYDENGNYTDLSDADANNSIFNKKYIKSIGFKVKGGRIFDNTGKLVGTFTRISFDDFSDAQNAVVFGLAARAGAMNQAIAAFGIGTFAIGATGGTAMYLGGAAFGSGVTTLGLAGGEASSSFVGVAAEEIIALNQSLGGTTTLTGEADTVVANMSYRVGFTDKAATVIRDIAGRHLFNDANKRTAQAVVELLAKRNGQSVNPAAVRAVIDKVATGAIRTVEEISAALKGGG